MEGFHAGDPGSNPLFFPKFRQFDYLLKKCLCLSGFEPQSAAWESCMLTTTPERYIESKGQFTYEYSTESDIIITWEGFHAGYMLAAWLISVSLSGVAVTWKVFMLATRVRIPIFSKI